MDDDRHYVRINVVWEELRVRGCDPDGDVICLAKAISIALTFLEEDDVLEFDYYEEQDLISDFVDSYKAADETSKRAISTLIENALKESDYFSVCGAIAEVALFKKWSGKVDKEFINALAVEASPQESDKNNSKPKKSQKNRSGYCGRK